MTGEIHSCGYQDSGIAHNCCKIVDSLKKEIEKLQNQKITLNDLTDVYQYNMINTLQKILEEKK